MIKRSLLILSIASLSINFINAQSITNSPYTRYGVGEIDRGGFGLNRAMGNISTGLRKANQINFLNPASISVQDTMSFIFDVGISGTSKTLSTSTLNIEYQNFYFDHLAISFPIQRWWFTSIGIVPYSRIGYNIESKEQFPFNDTINTIYNNYGNGGINQVYLSNSFKVTDNLSLGINLSYLFGSIEQYNIVSLDIKESYSTINTNEISLNKFTYDLGIQYSGTFKEKYFYNLGFVFSNKVKFAGTNNTTTLMAENFIFWDINILDYLTINSNLADTISHNSSDNYNVEIPAKYSIGFTTGIKDKLTAGFDFSIQDWSKIKTLNINDNFATDIAYNFGIEYIPNKFALRNYLNLINYRAGFYYNKGYLKLNNNQISSYGITFGVGLPVTNKSSINLYGVYGQRGTEKNGLIKEDFYLFGVNLTLYDFWFFKRRFE